MKAINLLAMAAIAVAATSCGSGNGGETTGEGLLAKHARFLTDPNSYVCYRTSGEIKVDGVLDEPAWQAAAETEAFSDISGEGFAEPKYATHAKMLWDDEYFYVGAVLEEPNIKALLTQRDTIIYRDNDFEIFIDPNGDAVNYFEFETNARGVLFDLILDRSYRSDGSFHIPWNCEGIKLAVHYDGTLNDATDTDRSWSVEWAIPAKSLVWNFDKPIEAGKTWRVNFSRVQWLKEGGPEENWVWSPTGKVDMHMADRWGYVYFSDKVVGTGTDEVKYPVAKPIYKLLWAMFYEQMDAKENGGFHKSLKEFGITAADKEGVPADAEIDVQATSKQFTITMNVPSEQMEYSLNNLGCFKAVSTAKEE